MTTIRRDSFGYNHRQWSWGPAFVTIMRSRFGISIIYGVKVGRLHFSTHRTMYVRTDSKIRKHPGQGFFK